MNLMLSDELEVRLLNIKDKKLGRKFVDSF